MAVTEVTPFDVSSDGIVVSLSAIGADGHVFTNNGREAIIIYNGSGSDRQLSVELNGITVDGQSPEDKKVTIANTEYMYVGPFNPAFYNYTSVGAYPGKTFFKLDAVVDVTGAVIRLGNYGRTGTS